jgi:hypothetical protein
MDIWNKVKWGKPFLLLVFSKDSKAHVDDDANGLELN